MYRVFFYPPKSSKNKKLIQARLGVSRPIYVNVDTPNLGFPYFNILGGYQLKKHPVDKPQLIFQILNINANVLTGCPKKMQHSDFLFRSAPEVQFNIFTCVSESEFRARSIWAHYRPPIQNLKCPKTLKMHARTLIFPHPSEVKPELCRLCTSSPIPICVGRHYYS